MQYSTGRDQRRALRLGRIGFVNVLPVYLHLTPDQSLFQEVRGTPSKLNHMLSRGLLDVSVASSVEYALRPEDYFTLPDLGISSWGRVRSVLLLSDLPMQQWEAGRIQCPMESETSVALLELLLNSHWGLEATLVSEEDPSGAVAFLRIGDRALREMASGRWGYIWDLGQAWLEWTGLPFVFALWLVRKQVVEQSPEAVAELHRALISSRDQGLKDLGGCISEAEAILGDLELDLQEYFKGLRFNLGTAEIEGLERFYLELTRAGRIPGWPELRFWPPGTCAKPV